MRANEHARTHVSPAQDALKKAGRQREKSSAAERSFGQRGCAGSLQRGLGRASGGGGVANSCSRARLRHTRLAQPEIGMKARGNQDAREKLAVTTTVASAR